MALLVCRATRKPDIKPGRFLLVTGMVNGYEGTLTLHSGPRAQDLQPLHKHGGASFAVPPAARANNLSAVVHHAGVVLVRPVPAAAKKHGDAPFVVEYGMQVGGSFEPPCSPPSNPPTHPPTHPGARRRVVCGLYVSPLPRAVAGGGGAGA